jgi:hypothetical protein
VQRIVQRRGVACRLGLGGKGERYSPCEPDADQNIANHHDFLEPTRRSAAAR